jgi:hypothetical protein
LSKLEYLVEIRQREDRKSGPGHAFVNTQKSTVLVSLTVRVFARSSPVDRRHGLEWNSPWPSFRAFVHSSLATLQRSHPYEQTQERNDLEGVQVQLSSSGYVNVALASLTHGVAEQLGADTLLQARTLLDLMPRPAEPPLLAKSISPLVWEQDWQKYLNAVYIKTPIALLKPRTKNSSVCHPSTAAIALYKFNHDGLCRLQRKIFHFVAEKCAEDDFERKWVAAGPKVQEECYFKAIMHICEVPEMESQRWCVELRSGASSLEGSILIFFSPQLCPRDQSS